MSEPVLPGTEPVRALAEGLTSLLPAMSSEQWVARLTEGPETLGRLVEQIQLHNGGRSTSVLIFIDQLEELVTLCGPRARDDLLVRIHLAIADVPQLWVVASLRSEFLTELLTSSHADLFQDPVVLGLLGKDALRRVIVGPAEAAGLTFVPPSLVDTMIEDAGGSDALPLLAYTLQELYLRVGKENVLREADYREMGGVEGALSKQANKVEGELRSAGDGPAVIPTLLKLVTFDGAEPTRRRVRRNAFDAQQQRVADAFVSARLLTSDAESGDGTVTVAHEALFRVWAPLKDAVHEEEDTLRLRNDLEQRAMDWDRSGRPEEDLLRGERLRTARGGAS